MNPPGLVAVWPSLFITTTLDGPAEPAGVVAVIVVGDTTVAPVAETPPTVTPNEPPEAKFVPVIVIAVPPAVGPDDGDTVEIVGAGGAEYVKLRLLVAV